MPLTAPRRRAPRRPTNRRRAGGDDRGGSTAVGVPCGVPGGVMVGVVIGVVVGVSALLGGCATGQRPTLEDVAQTDDPAAATVIRRLDRAAGLTFTATYRITPIGAADATIATVRQQDGRRRVTIGEVDYVTDGAASTTCLLATGECFDFLDDARVSDLAVTNRFWADGFATRLTVDAARRVGFSTGTTETIAGQPAVCASVPVLGGDKLYCALDEGVLARYFGADVTIELVSYSNEVDPAELTGSTMP